MKTTTWARNSSGLVAHARQRSEQTSQRVEGAITTLLREQAPITFSSVAQAANVSKQYLYSQAQLRSRIAALRDQHREQTLRERQVRPGEKTAASKDFVILAKDRRIKELEDEVRRLKQDLQVALGKLYDRV